MSTVGQAEGVGPLLVEANLNAETMINIMQTHTVKPELPPEDKLTPPKLVEQAARLLK